MSWRKFDASDFMHGVDALACEAKLDNIKDALSIAQVMRSDLEDHTSDAAKDLSLYLDHCIDLQVMPDPEAVREHATAVVIAVASAATMGNVMTHRRKSDAMHKGKQGKAQERDAFIVKVYTREYLDSFGGGRNAPRAAQAIRERWHDLTLHTDLESTKPPSLRIIADAIRNSGRYSNN